MPDTPAPADATLPPIDPASGPVDGVADAAAPDAAALQRAAQHAPDGPNVAPSPWEHTAAQGELPAQDPDGGVPAPRAAATVVPPSDPSPGENVP